MNVNKNDLKYNNCDSGYRIVYFYDDSYKVGEYCKTISGFMIGFSKCDPIIDDSDIPEFISTSDLLKRYLDDVKNSTGVAIYDVNGNCIDKLFREKNELKK